MNGLIKEVAHALPDSAAIGSLSLVLFFGVYLAIILRLASRKLDGQMSEAASMPLLED